VTGLAGRAWIDAVKALDLPFLRIVVIGEMNARDLYCEWQRIREIEEAGALLVRPDGYVAWREMHGLFDNAVARDTLRAVICELLGKDSIARDTCATGKTFSTDAATSVS
jgi:2,4-dichlorophenol 6-monooxygenase